MDESFSTQELSVTAFLCRKSTKILPDSFVNRNSVGIDVSVRKLHKYVVYERVHQITSVVSVQTHILVE